MYDEDTDPTQGLTGQNQGMVRTIRIPLPTSWKRYELVHQYPDDCDLATHGTSVDNLWFILWHQKLKASGAEMCEGVKCQCCGVYLCKEDLLKEKDHPEVYKFDPAVDTDPECLPVNFDNEENYEGSTYQRGLAMGYSEWRRVTLTGYSGWFFRTAFEVAYRRDAVPTISLELGGQPNRCARGLR